MSEFWVVFAAAVAGLIWLMRLFKDGRKLRGKMSYRQWEQEQRLRGRTVGDGTETRP